MSGPLRVLIHGINFAPEPTGIGKYTGEMALWLLDQGHDVRVVTAPPYYPDWKLGEGYKGWQYRRERITGAVGNAMSIWRCPVWVPHRPTGLRRVVHLFSFAVSSFPVVLAQALWRPDVVFAIEPTLFCAPQAWLTARLGGGKPWLHVQDFEVDAAFELGILRSRLLRRFVAKAERFIMRRFAVVSTISDRMMAGLKAKGVSEAQLTFFPNWVDTHAIYPLVQESVIRRELGLTAAHMVALYSGNMGAKQGLELIVEAARALEQYPDIQFVMCGAGPARKELENMSRGCSNLHWLPLQPLERLNDLLNLADIHLLPQRVDAADLVMPSKLTGMLSSGRPVVATAAPGSEVAKVVEGKGIAVPPGDAGAFAGAIRDLAANHAFRQEMGRAAREYATRTLDRNLVLENFQKALS